MVGKYSTVVNFANNMVTSSSPVMMSTNMSVVPLAMFLITGMRSWHCGGVFQPEVSSTSPRLVCEHHRTATTLLRIIQIDGIDCDCDDILSSISVITNSMILFLMQSHDIVSPYILGLHLCLSAHRHQSVGQVLHCGPGGGVDEDNQDC